ncbi:hypothetical protein XELAEV_18037831mg [Xenopus laevis]|uniref:CTCK domain-containing protein n=1 Tax=Xenopus laevis TaxID=8355 RepID=A0A974HAZ3_XENLA|nr:hypothetical protein XELAEV_18037831mg [Xenopus laevis]
MQRAALSAILPCSRLLKYSYSKHIFSFISEPKTTPGQPELTTTPRPPIITTPPECAGVTCIKDVTCRYNEIEVAEPNPLDPCCPKYHCGKYRPELTTTPRPPIITTPPECAGVTCIKDVTCRYNEIEVAEPNPFDPCCPKYHCEPKTTPGQPELTTTPRPPIITTPPECAGVTCIKDVTCRYNEIEVAEPNPFDPCCPKYHCEPKTTPGQPECAGVTCIKDVTCRYNEIEVAEPNPFDPCCPKYHCEPKTTPGQPELTTTPRPPIITTPPKTTPGQPECAGVTCTKDVTCRYNEIEVAEPNPFDPCCPKYHCEPKTTPGQPELTTTPRPPIITTPPECAGVTCIKDVTCRYNEIEVAEPNPLDPCCPKYHCEPKTTPSQPECAGITCYKEVTCKYNEIEIEEPNPFDPCCPRYHCAYGDLLEQFSKSLEVEGKSFDRSLNRTIERFYFDRSIAKFGKKSFDFDIRSRSILIQWSNFKTMPPTTKRECANVKCYKDVVCGPNENEVEEPNPFDPCCPKYHCAAKQKNNGKTPSTSTIISTTKIECSKRICVKTSCRLYEKLIETPNPYDPCCPIQKCECQCKTVPTCRSDERLVTVSQAGQCCPKLKCERKKDECHPVSKSVLLTSGQCSASVELNVCSGYCHSKTEYTSFWQPISHCRCCSIKTDRFMTFQLPCLDGTRTSLTVRSAVTCGCNTCSGPYEPASGSGSGSRSSDGGSDEGSGFQS